MAQKQKIILFLMVALLMIAITGCTEDQIIVYDQKNITNNYNDSLWNQTGTSIYYSSGSVGIGVSSPSFPFEVQNSAAAVARFKSTGGGATRFYIDYDGATAEDNDLGRITFRWNGNQVAGLYAYAGDDTTNKDNGKIALVTFPSSGNPNIRLIADESGRIGIGTITPDYPLTVAVSNVLETLVGVSKFTATGSGNYMTISSFRSATVGNRHMEIQVKDTGNTVRDLSLNPEGGSVGIGTAYPNATLSVTGTIETNSKAGITDSGDTCTITEITNGVITSASCT